MSSSLCSNAILAQKNILSYQADVVVNITTSRGSMKSQKLCGSSLANHISKPLLSKINKYCRHRARMFAFIPSFIIGRKPGDFFTSPAFCFNCKEIIHAVGALMFVDNVREKTAIVFLNSVFRYCRLKNYKTIAIPSFTVRNHEFEKHYTYELIKTVASVYPELFVTVIE